jgi:hypothetical protein
VSCKFVLVINLVLMRQTAVDDAKPSYGKSSRSLLNDSMKERMQWKDPET